MMCSLALGSTCLAECCDDELEMMAASHSELFSSSHQGKAGLLRLRGEARKSAGNMDHHSIVGEEWRETGMGNPGMESYVSVFATGSPCCPAC